MTTTTVRRTATAGAYGLRRYLETPEGGELVLDRAVLGELPTYELEELAGDYGVDYPTAARVVREALEEGF